MSAHCRGGSLTARARTWAFFVSNCVSPNMSDAVAKKSRVRACSSESVVGMKNDALFAEHGVKGRESLVGRGVKPHKTYPSHKTMRRSVCFSALAASHKVYRNERCGRWEGKNAGLRQGEEDRSLRGSDSASCA